MNHHESFTTIPKKQKNRRGHHHVKALPIELSLLATVENLYTDRGFGFVTCQFDASRQFFHATGALTDCRDFSAMAVGDRVLCQLGPSPRTAPSPRTGQMRVLQWIHVDDLDWHSGVPPSGQSELDAFRSEFLRKRSIDYLRQRLSASWYAELVGANAKPELHDPVLLDAWLNNLAELYPEALKNMRYSEVIKGCLYDFFSQLDLKSAKCDFRKYLEMFSLAQLAAMGAPQVAWLRLLDGERKAALLEWFLLSGARRAKSDDCKAWLTGCADYEGAVAERIIDSGETLPAVVRQWVFVLASKGWLSQACIDRLAVQDVSAAVHLFERLSPAVQSGIVEGWTQNAETLAAALNERLSLAPVVAVRCALAIDLETDGERIWEIGCAQGDGAARLYDEQSGTDIELALADLSGLVSNAAFIVGQNIVAWDWPIISPRLAMDAKPLIWDTLLVQFLMEPQAASHALGGSHHADDDAVATLTLFARQLARLSPAFVVRLLTGQFHDAAALLEALALALGNEVLLARPAPKILEDAGRTPPRILVLPEARIRNFDWIPGVVVTPVDPQQRLPVAFWQIDAAKLESVASELSRDVFALVLLAVVRRAFAEGIVLRRNMLPAWLLERSPDLSAAVDLACVIPASGQQICVSPLPDSADWWSQADGAIVRAALPDGPVLIVDRNVSLDDGSARLAQEHPASLLRLSEEAAGRWVYPDRPARLLDRLDGWRCFRTVEVPKFLIVDLPPSSASATRPVVLSRQQQALHPGSGDQASYWVSVLEAFRNATATETGAVPVLLIGSTASFNMVDLLSTALAEIGMGEIRPAHRTRREHLIRGSKLGFGIVDFVDSWGACRGVRRK